MASPHRLLWTLPLRSRSCPGPTGGLLACADLHMPEIQILRQNALSLSLSPSLVLMEQSFKEVI